MLYILFGSFILMCILRVPVAVGLFLSSTLAIVFQGSIPLTIVVQRMWVGLNSFPLLAVPFFLFVGQLMNEAGISRRLIGFSNSTVGHFKGGLAHVNVVVSMIFAGISGASSADTAGVGSILIPSMEKEGYPLGFTVGITAASSTLGNIIPPSIMMIIYSATAGLSVGGMFLTGIIPGILIGMSQILYAVYFTTKHNIGGSYPFNFKNFLRAFKESFAALVIPVLVMGGIIFGVFTATEAGVIAVLYSMILTFFYRELNLKKFIETIKTSVGMFSLSLFAVAAASLWGWVLAFYNVPQNIVAALTQAGLLSSPAFVWIFTIVTFIAVGTFMDAVPAIIILQPVFGPIAMAVGIDPYHMGIVVVLTLAIGLMTPPYGLCLLIAADIAKISVPKAMRAMIPFYILSFLIVLIAVTMPGLMLWLPRVFLI